MAEMKSNIARRIKESQSKSSETRYTTMKFRYFVVVLERALKRGKIEEAIAILADFSKRHPGSQMLIPEEALLGAGIQFALFGLCTRLVGTYSPTVTATITVTPGTANMVVSVTYTTGATAGCVVDIDTVTIGATSNPITGTAIYSPVPLGVPAAGVVSGTYVYPNVAGGANGAALLIGSSVNLIVTFSATTANGSCDSCTLLAPATNPVTVGVIVV